MVNFSGVWVLVTLLDALVFIIAVLVLAFLELLSLILRHILLAVVLTDASLLGALLVVGNRSLVLSALLLSRWGATLVPRLSLADVLVTVILIVTLMDVTAVLLPVVIIIV